MSFQLAFALNASLQIFHLKIHHHVSLIISSHWSMTITLYSFHIKPVIEFLVLFYFKKCQHKVQICRNLLAIGEGRLIISMVDV